VSEENGLSLALRYKDTSQQVVLLVTTNSETCGKDRGHKILSVLPLPTIGKDQFSAINSDCFSRNGTIAKGVTVVGIFSEATASSATPGPAPATSAWLVNFSARRFERVTDVACRSFQ